MLFVCLMYRLPAWLCLCIPVSCSHVTGPRVGTPDCSYYVAYLLPAGLYYLVVVWVVWSEVSYLGFCWSMLSACLSFWLPAWLCFCTGFISVVLGWWVSGQWRGGGPLVKFVWFSRMVSCVGHFDNVIVGWVFCQWWGGSLFSPVLLVFLGWFPCVGPLR